MAEVYVDGQSLVPFDRALLDPNNPAFGGGPRARQQGVFALPHVLTYSSMMNLATQAYSWRWDEAMKTSREDALAMRRDPFVMGIVQERKLACSQLNWHLEPEEPKDKRQKACAEYLTKIIERTPNFPQFRFCLQEAVWFGRYGIHEALTWQDQGARPPEIPGPSKSLQITGWRPINGDKIQHRYALADDNAADNTHSLGKRDDGKPKVIEDGTPIILINAAYAARIPKSETVLTDRGWALLLRTPYWRERFVLHKHELDDADFFEAEMAGGVHGVGIRSRIYWCWWLKQEFLGNVVDYIQRVGQGTTVFYYEAGNPQSEAEAIKAANQISTNTVIVWPRPIGTEKQGAGMERFEMPMGGSEMLIKLQEYMDRIIERFIIGQSASSRSETSGMGTHDTGAQQDTKFRIVKFDAGNVDATLTNDLVKPLQRWNCPHEKYPIRFVSDVDKPDAKDQLEAANKAWTMGAEIKEEEVLSYAGLSKPQPDDKTLKNPQMQQQPGGMPGMPGMPGAPGAAPGGLAEGPVGGGEPSDSEIDKLLAELMPEGDPGAEEGGGDVPAEQMARRQQARRYLAAFARRHYAVHYGKEDPAKKTLRWKGLTIAIENPAGSVRKWTNRHGESGEQVIKHDYGYIRHTDGADGDAVDVFMGPDLDSETVFIINQIEPKSGDFDEHKCVLGASSEEEAKDIYLSNYQPGWKGLGDIVEIPLEAFKEWLESGETSEPAEEPAEEVEHARHYARRWVKSEADVPKGKTAIKGPKGGVYYETGGKSSGKPAAKKTDRATSVGNALGKAATKMPDSSRAIVTAALKNGAASDALHAVPRNLASAFRKLPPQDRGPIEEALKAMGAEKVGEPGEQTKFVARLHEASPGAGGLFPGDDAVVTIPGWVIHDDKGEFLLSKAVVGLPNLTGLRKVAAAMGVEGAEAMDKPALTKAVVSKAMPAPAASRVTISPYKSARERAGMSLTQLSLKAGVAEPKLRLFEAGEKKPTALERRSIEGALGAKIEDAAVEKVEGEQQAKPSILEATQKLADSVKAGDSGYLDLVRHMTKVDKLPQAQLLEMVAGLGIKERIDGAGPVRNKDDALKAIHRWILGGPGSYHSKEAMAS